MATPADRSFPRQITQRGLSRRRLHDLYHYLLNRSWLYLIGLFVLLYLASNLLFATAYHLAGNAVENARSFADLFFFSVQTMATIGYGQMVPHTVVAHTLVTVEAFAGMLEVAMFAGLLFAKFSRPTARVLFSRVAAVSVREGVPSLMFRMANERANQIVEAQLRLVLARDEVTREGEQIRRFHDLKLVRERNATFALTWTAIHPIDEKSPLYGASSELLARQRAEIIASVMGLDETFSQNIHARYSYFADTVVWNARLVDILVNEPDGKRYVDYQRFHDVQAVSEK
jgi:inward rectifier potassium channel